MKPIEVYASRTRLILIFLGAAAFVWGGFWILSLPPGTMSLYKRCGGAVGIPFFGTIGCFALWRIFRRKPVLIIDERGLTENSSGISVGFIPWEDIVSAKISSIMGKPYIGIKLRKPEKYILQANWFKRPLIRLNLWQYGYAVTIMQISLPTPLNELLEGMEQFAGRHLH